MGGMRGGRGGEERSSSIRTIEEQSDRMNDPTANLQGWLCHDFVDTLWENSLFVRSPLVKV